jgi:GNAT superfamily N-acetyltransferase
MPDLLVRLYDLPTAETSRPLPPGVVVRRALPPERDRILKWIDSQFGGLWAPEAAMAFAQLPVTIWIAVRHNAILGFACHDATAKGVFGPTGVAEAARGQGIGEALLLAALRGMREAGYVYGVIGNPGPLEFYRRRLPTVDIPGSDPGFYAGMLRPES